MYKNRFALYWEAMSNLDLFVFLMLALTDFNRILHYVNWILTSLIVAMIIPIALVFTPMADAPVMIGLIFLGIVLWVIPIGHRFALKRTPQRYVPEGY